MTLALLAPGRPALSELPNSIGIVSGPVAQKGLPLCRPVGLQPEAFWTPSEQQVLALEKRLVPHLEQLNLRGDLPIEMTLDGYGRQYYGLTVGDDNFYYGSFFPMKGFIVPNDRTLSCCDCGPRYWGIVFDIQNMSFREPVFTGVYPGDTRSNTLEWPAPYDSDSMPAEIDQAGSAVRTVESLLVNRRYEELAALSRGEGMSAVAIKAAVRACGCTLTHSPTPGRRSYTVRHVVGQDTTVEFSLWTIQDGEPAVAVTFALADIPDEEPVISILTILLERD